MQPACVSTKPESGQNQRPPNGPQAKQPGTRVLRPWARDASEIPAMGCSFSPAEILQCDAAWSDDFHGKATEAGHGASRTHGCFRRLAGLAVSSTRQASPVRSQLGRGHHGLAKPHPYKTDGGKYTWRFLKEKNGT